METKCIQANVIRLDTLTEQDAFIYQSVVSGLRDINHVMYYAHNMGNDVGVTIIIFSFTLKWVVKQ